MMSYVIGVDAGGTTSSACAFDLGGQLLCCHLTGAGNFSVDRDEAWDHITEAIDNCIQELSGVCVYVAVGAAGIRGAGLEEEICIRLKERYRCPAKACDDGVMALYAKLQGQDGLMVIAGTGSVVYAKAGDNVISSGGWGMLLDDRGSGTAIVLNAFRNMVFGYDEGRSVSPMEVELLKKIHCDSPRYVPRFLYRVSKREIAALMPIIAEHAAKGEKDALTLLEHAGRKLGEMAFEAAKRLELERPLVAISGSILEKCNLVLDAFWRKWVEEYPESRLVSGEERVEKGALWFYREEKI